MPTPDAAKNPCYWNLYWVESDGFEDCFVVARNSRSACGVEIYENGFDPTQVHATKITRVPRSAEISCRKNGKRDWPWYVYGKTFFEDVGAHFQTVIGVHEMLLNDVVYSVEDENYAPCNIVRKRSIGQKAISELTAIPEINQYEYLEEDIWENPTNHLITCLGMCVATCQLIEHYIANSFLLGISKRQKRRYETINDLREGWRKKTLGNMLKCIEEAWEIDPLLKASLDLFLENRNRLIHGITTDEQYDIRTHWGREELIAFLSFFDVHARITKAAFRASFYASIEFGVHHWGTPKGIPKKILGKKQKEEARLFFVLFKPRPGAI